MRHYQPTIGLTCKACDVSLDDTGDGELCSTCLEAVMDVNKDLYEDEEGKVRCLLNT